MEGFKLTLTSLKGIPGIPGRAISLMSTPKLLNNVTLRGLRSTYASP